MMVVLFLVYFVTRLWGIDVLPVFADEAIYIRWGQLIIDDPSQYAFFALNDGKTPLFIWLISGFQFLFNDQLVAGRMVSVVFGFLQLLILWWTLRVLKLQRESQAIGLIWVIVLPFWYFHHRMAIMDGALTVFVSAASTMVVVLAQKIQHIQYKKAAILDLVMRGHIRHVVVIGSLLGFGLLTKVPAILAFPGLFLSILFVTNTQQAIALYAQILKAVGVGLIFFVLLKIHPAFSQLFSRGSDFLYPVSDVLAGSWRDTLSQIPTYVSYFVTYLGPLVLFLSLTSLFSRKNKRAAHYFFWSGILFALPIIVLGRVVYPRYLFPVSWFITVAAIIGFDDFVSLIKRTVDVRKKAVIGVILSLLCANSIGIGLEFMHASVVSTNNIPFVSADRKQYITEWSAGTGIQEVTELILQESKEQKVAVATEGYFGTLPDGVLMYLHGETVDNLYVEGIGQPVVAIPESFSNRAQEFDAVWLLVNNTRNKLTLADEQLLNQWCSPSRETNRQFDRCLELWDISHLTLAEPAN